jgi:hypothetical protein
MFLVWKFALGIHKGLVIVLYCLNRSRVFHILILLSTLVGLASCGGSSGLAVSAVPPNPPGDLHFEVVDEGLLVSWKPVPGASNYSLFWGPEKFDFRRIVETSTPAVLIKGIENGDLNYFAATARSAHAESRFSSQEPYVYDIDPKNAPIHMQQALRLENRGNLGEALLHLSVAIKLDSENPYLYRKRAQLRELIGLTKEAKKDLDTAEKLYMKKPISFKDSGD